MNNGSRTHMDMRDGMKENHYYVECTSQSNRFIFRWKYASKPGHASDENLIAFWPLSYKDFRAFLEGGFPFSSPAQCTAKPLRPMIEDAIGIKQPQRRDMTAIYESKQKIDCLNSSRWCCMHKLCAHAWNVQRTCINMQNTFVWHATSFE